METIIEQQATETHHKHFLILKKGLQFFNIRATEIAYFFTENKIAFAVDRVGTRYMSDRNISELAGVLDPEMFFRANRKYIVNAYFIKSYQPVDRVKIKIDMDTMTLKNDIIVSQLSAPAFRKWIHSR